MSSHLDDEILEEILEYDIFVRMSPRREYTIDLKIASIAKAKPMSEPERTHRAPGGQSARKRLQTAHRPMQHNGDKVT